MICSKTDIIKELDEIRNIGYYILENYSIDDKIETLQSILKKYKKLYLNQNVEFPKVAESMSTQLVKSDNINIDCRMDTSNIKKPETIVIENNNQIQIIDKQIQVINNNKQVQVTNKRAVSKIKKPFYDEHELLEPNDLLIKNFLTGITKNMVRKMSNDAEDIDDKEDIHELVEITSRGIDLFAKRMKPKNNTSSKYEIGALAAKAVTIYGYKKLIDSYKK